MTFVLQLPQTPTISFHPCLQLRGATKRNSRIHPLFVQTMTTNATMQQTRGITALGALQDLCRQTEKYQSLV